MLEPLFKQYVYTYMYILIGIHKLHLSCIKLQTVDKHMIKNKD